jgi:SAM-dependent methyltransferase
VETLGDEWSVGRAYDAYMGRWSRLVAREFVRWLGPARGRRWLDVGCGTGALAYAILEDAAPRSIVGVDRSKGFVAHARARARDARAAFQVADARALPIAGDRLDVVVSGLALNFVPAPAAMVAEMARVGRPGGTIALYVWDYAGGMELLRRFWSAARTLDPAAAVLDEAGRFPGCAPAPLGALFVAAGLSGVETRGIEVAIRFRDFDDCWSPFLGGQGPAPAYVVSLPDDRRSALRELLRAALPVAPDGSVPLTARAWAVRGTRPRPGDRTGQG